jgi:hypothetical protein
MKFRVYIEKDEAKFYYAGYQPNGGAPILTENKDTAYHFQNLPYAENFMAADERFSAKSGAKVEPVA